MEFKLSQFVVIDTLTLLMLGFSGSQRNILMKVMLPYMLHARVRFVFDQLKNENCCVFMDNLYLLALFARRVMGSDNCVKIFCVTRRKGKGIPS